MNRPENIECFEIMAGALLGHLYLSFPRPQSIQCASFQKDLRECDILPRKCVWEESLGSPGVSLVAATMTWLMEEGYVRADCKPNSTLLKSCILSARGFQALNTPIEVGGETIGLRLGNLRKATNYTASEIMRALLNAGAEAGASSIFKGLGFP